MKWKRSLWGPAQCEMQSQTKQRGGGGWRGCGGAGEPKERKLPQSGSETPADNLQILQDWPPRKMSPLPPNVIVLPAGGAKATRPFRLEQRSGWKPIFASHPDGNHRHTGKEDNRGLQIKPDVPSVSYSSCFKFLPCYATPSDPRAVLAPSQSSIFEEGRPSRTSINKNIALSF